MISYTGKPECDIRDVLIAELTTQRDELLAALKKLSGMKLNMIADGIVDKAIAAVRGAA